MEILPNLKTERQAHGGLAPSIPYFQILIPFYKVVEFIQWPIKPLGKRLPTFVQVSLPITRPARNIMLIAVAADIRMPRIDTKP